jgi:hypothetical protein
VTLRRLLGDVFWAVERTEECAAKNHFERSQIGMGQGALAPALRLQRPLRRLRRPSRIGGSNTPQTGGQKNPAKYRPYRPQRMKSTDLQVFLAVDAFVDIARSSAFIDRVAEYRPHYRPRINYVFCRSFIFCKGAASDAGDVLADFF